MTEPQPDAARDPRQYGFVEWFRPGEYERTERLLPQIIASGASYLRTHLSWAEYLAPGGEEWFDWLMPQLGSQIDLLPCLHYTPPSMSRTGRSNGPPQDLKSYADFVDHVLTRYGEHFTHVELWNEPNNLLDWDWREDTDFLLFSEMVGGAAYWAKQRGFKPVLGGPCPFDPYWLNLMGERGVLNVVDAVGFHGFPGTWDSEEGTWGGWDMHLGEMRRIIDRFNPAIRNLDHRNRLFHLAQRRDGAGPAVHEGSDRAGGSHVLVFLAGRGAGRAGSGRPVVRSAALSPRCRHHDNQPKLLARLLLEGGVSRLEDVAKLATPNLSTGAAPIVVTGGSGFIGSNLADSFLRDGEDVVILDNLGRSGVDQNLGWLTQRHGERVHPVLADVRDLRGIEAAFTDAKAVFHLAAQTAVTTSLVHPIDDFEANARGTINVLESVRKAGKRAPVIFASTNKVYGALEDVHMLELDDRYIPATRRSAHMGSARTARSTSAPLWLLQGRRRPVCAGLCKVL
jgi:CDP-paratose 2-epimerase